MPFANSSIGVVGATGFIGRTLVGAFAAEGAGRVRLFGRGGGVVQGISIEPLNLSPEAFRGLDCVIHLSGITTSRAPEAMLQAVNVTLAAEVASAAAAAGVKRLVFVSSLHVHGKSASIAISPDSPMNPDNAYGRSKAAAELELDHIAQGTGLEVVTLRPPMVYGAAAKGSFRLLVRLVRSGLPLPLGLARGRRTFCSVGNLTSAILHSAIAPKPAKVLIPADPDDFDTQILVSAIGAALGRKVRLWPVPKTILALPLAALGRSEMITSLFEPLLVNRSHWQAQAWRPIETGPEAIRAALAEQASAAEQA